MCGIKALLLSPTLFAIDVNDIVSRLPFGQNYAIVLYADDILLLAPSVIELQTLLPNAKSN